MATTPGTLRWLRNHPTQMLAIVVAVVVLVAAGAVGIQARQSATELSRRMDGWKQAQAQLETVQQRFRVPSNTEAAALVAESAHMTALGVPDGERVTIMDFLTRLAEASSLENVRVNFTSDVDSTYAPERPIGSTAIHRAPYVVTLDVGGSFARVVEFVGSLPPSVSVARIGAARSGGLANYHLVLSVYELPQDGNAG